MPQKSTSRPTPAKRRILIVDGHSLVRRGLAALIDAEPDLIVCAQSADRREGIAAIAVARPDLVIADLSLRDGDGLDLVREIRAGYASLPVLVLSMHGAPLHARRAFTAGASGYVSKQEMTETLLLAIRSVLRGEEYMRSAAPCVPDAAQPGWLTVRG